jgi:hypothetical protein
MTFREATDELFAAVEHAKLARALGVSVAAIRQARLKESAKAYRPPPKDWEHGVIRLAEERVWHYRQLIEKLRNPHE